MKKFSKLIFSLKSYSKAMSNSGVSIRQIKVYTHAMYILSRWNGDYKAYENHLKEKLIENGYPGFLYDEEKTYYDDLRILLRGYNV